MTTQLAKPLRSLAAIAALLSLCLPSYSQSYEAIEWSVNTDRSGFAWSHPKDWKLSEDPAFVSIMWSSDDSAYCTLKRTADWSFTIMTPKEYVEFQLEQRSMLEEMLVLQYPEGDGKLILARDFPFGQQDGMMMLTSGTMNGQPIVNTVFQTIDSGALFTLSCFTAPENQGYYFPIFTQFPDHMDFQVN